MITGIRKRCQYLLSYYKQIFLLIKNSKKMRPFQGKFLKVAVLLLVPLVYPEISIKIHAIHQVTETLKVGIRPGIYNILQESDTARIRADLEKNLNNSRLANDLQGIALNASNLGKYFYSQNDLAKAETFFMESLNASKTISNGRLEANNSNNLGLIARATGDYSKAASYFLSAIVLLDSLNDKPGLAAAASNLSGVYYMLSETDKALEFVNLSLKMKNQLNDSLSLVSEYLLLGDIYFELMKYDSSKYFYNRCIKLSENLSDHANAGKACNSIGVIAMYEKNEEQALDSYNKALHYSRINNDIQNISSVYNNLGILNFRIDKLDEALTYFDSSLTLSKQYGLKEEMKDAYRHIADVHRKKEDYKDAYLNLQQYYDLHNEWLIEKGDVAGIEALFIKLKQENRILSLEKEQEKRKSQIVLLNAVIIIMLISALLGFRIYRISQKSKNARKIAELEKERFKAVIEAQEAERKRIAGDLHDSVGQMLSLTKLHLSGLMDLPGAFAPEHEQTITNSTRIIDEVCQEVRNISHNLMPGPLIRLGLTAAVKELVRKINLSEKIQASFICNLNSDRLDENIEISLYRIVQEILSNILKHANATKIGITLNRHKDEYLDLAIIDNGIGFDTELIKISSGIGWKNIHSRLSIINGTMNIKSGRNSGSHISIRIIL